MRNGAYSLQTNAPPAWDFLGVKFTSTETSTFVRRNLPAATQTQNVDASSAEFEPAMTYTATATGPGGGTSWADAESITANGTIFTLSGPQFIALPADQRRPGDIYRATGGFAPTNSPNTVLKSTSAATPSNFSFTMPTAAASPTWSMQASGSNALFHASWTPDPSAALYRFEIGAAGDPADGPAWYALVTNGWLAAGATKSYITPNLSSLPGWNSKWNLPPSLNNLEVSSFASPQGIPGILRYGFLAYGGISPLDGDSLTEWNYLYGNGLNISGSPRRRCPGR